ncbi:hypothetical protein [Nocardioides zhouii]|uniref:Lipoprotein n=1 Tax=Nocardioides zhouii TaxID=1168729 RepID=A0A4Q2SY93_9ACTN|nr:hypothetical protein [Nocardioides zhouii]RYC10441.1 hypothetical protein EUA94_13020 [Nocardioides zhouii]
MTTSLRRSGVRTRTAALLTSLALTAGVSACSGDDGGDTATDPDATSDSASSTPSPSEDSPSETPTETASDGGGPGTAQAIDAIGSAGVTKATMVHATEVGGSASTLAFVLDTDQAINDFVGQFDAAFAPSIGAAIGAESGLAPDATPYAATVAVGCDDPRNVAIDAGEAGFEVVPKLPKNGVQCLAPMTYVVVFTVPDA